MSVELDWRIPRIWKTPDNIISTVSYVIEFTDDRFPGQSSVHGGIVSISSAALPETASREQIATAVLNTMPETYFDGLVGFHVNQMEFEYERATNEEVIIDPDPVDPTPQNLTARQLRLGLITNGISTSTVDAAIAAIEDATEREIAQTEWEYASTFERTHPLITKVGLALGLTEEQIDAMWLSAATL